MLSLQAGVIRETLKTSKHLDFRDYYYIVAPDYELTRLINTGANIADVFSDIGAYFKGPGSRKTVERNDELFGRAAKQMKEFLFGTAVRKNSTSIC
jgi:hypothetical protein